jgi:hypothetical protein
MPLPAILLLELARVDDARATHPVPVRQRPLANVGDDLDAVTRAERDACRPWEVSLVEELDRSEAVDELASPLLREDGEPECSMIASHVTALFGSTQCDHRPALASVLAISSIRATARERSFHRLARRLVASHGDGRNQMKCLRPSRRRWRCALRIWITRSSWSWTRKEA